MAITDDSTTRRSSVDVEEGKFVAQHGDLTDAEKALFDLKRNSVHTEDKPQITSKQLSEQLGASRTAKKEVKKMRKYVLLGILAFVLYTVVTAGIFVGVNYSVKDYQIHNAVMEDNTGKPLKTAPLVHFTEHTNILKWSEEELSNLQKVAINHEGKKFISKVQAVSREHDRVVLYFPKNPIMDSYTILDESKFPEGKSAQEILEEEAKAKAKEEGADIDMETADEGPGPGRRLMQMVRRLLAASIWSKSANSTFGVNAELSTWGAAVTPGLGPYVGYHTGVGGY